MIIDIEFSEWEKHYKLIGHFNCLQPFLAAAKELQLNWSIIQTTQTHIE